jgi:uncharacterized MAPEG superfamily protein
MHTVIACLLIATFMPLICAWIGGYYRYQQFNGVVDNKHPRIQASKLEGVGHRAYAAQQNCWEALAVFAAALLALHMGGVVLASVATACIVFVLLRTAYIACYLANQDLLRSSFFIAAFGVNIYFFYLALII